MKQIIELEFGDKVFIFQDSKFEMVVFIRSERIDGWGQTKLCVISKNGQIFRVDKENIFISKQEAMFALEEQNKKELKNRQEQLEKWISKSQKELNDLKKTRGIL